MPTREQRRAHAAPEKYADWLKQAERLVKRGEMASLLSIPVQQAETLAKQAEARAYGRAERAITERVISRTSAEDRGEYVADAVAAYARCVGRRAMGADPATEDLVSDDDEHAFRDALAMAIANALDGVALPAGTISEPDRLATPPAAPVAPVEPVDG